MAELLKVIKNDEEGFQVEITEFSRGGYTVGIRDTDCGERLPEAKIFPRMEDAIVAATLWAKGESGSEMMDISI